MKIILAIVLTMSMGAMGFGAEPAISYTLGMSKPSTHLLEVEISFDHLPKETQTLELLLPVWRPGRYVVLDFASGVQEFSVAAGNLPLQWEKREKSKWQIHTQGSTSLTVRYKVYADEFNQRTRGLNDEHAFVDGTSVFMYTEEYRNRSITLHVKPYKNWHVTTGLEGSGTEFAAPDYDTFVDCPLEIGTQKDFPFEVEGIPHTLSIYGSGNWAADTLIRDISTIVRANKAFWGDLPYTKYVFLLYTAPNAGGGTEHLNSTILQIRPYVFKNPNSYRGFLSLVSHEYFHTWNVKRFRPKGIHPYNYMKENYSPELWVAEGTTSYYEHIILVRAGLIKPDQMFEMLAGAIQDDRMRPGNNIQSVADASFDAWVKFWHNDEQAFNSESDYYGKGALVSCLLDLEIRQRSGGTHSLDDVMRSLYHRFPLSSPGYTQADLKQLAEEFAGGKMDDFFTRYVNGVAPLPWESVLGLAGMELTPKESIGKPWLGVVANDMGEKTKIVRVVAGSPGYNAGLDINDELLALNGKRVRSADLGERIAEMKAGDNVGVTVFRDDALREFRVTLENNPTPSYTIKKVPSPTEQQKELYRSWLGQLWDSPEKTTTSSH